MSAAKSTSLPIGRCDGGFRGTPSILPFAAAPKQRMFGVMNGETADILGFDFVLVPFAETRSVQLPCVYLMAHRDPGGVRLHHIHYAGQTQNLAERFCGHHRLEAAISAGATHALALWVEALNDRLNLETLLRYHYRPPLNAEEVPNHAQGWGAAIACNRPLLAADARRAQMSGMRYVMRPASASPPLSRRG